MGSDLDQQKASLVTPDAVLMRGAFPACLQAWAALPEGVQRQAYIEFPTMVMGRYALYAMDLRHLARVQTPRPVAE